MTEYFTIAELPDRPMFRCERLSATLQVQSCADRWREANSKNSPERLSMCRTCPLGAKHAGENCASTSALRGTDTCSRCHRTGQRLVGKDICVSCWNRQREYLIGRNAKGRPPRFHPPLARRSIRIRAGDEVLVIEREHSASVEELMIAALRDTSRQVFFGFKARETLQQGALC